MKILFIENRYKTRLWEQVAAALLEDGHEVVWLVQNHLFRPDSRYGKSFVMPYPKGRESITSHLNLKDVIYSDRNINYFGRSDTSYFSYYQNQVSRFFDESNLDVVFGESTLFHELLAVAECKRRGIPFFQPLTTRYPVGRFSFYSYDTLQPVAGSGEALGTGEAIEVINAIQGRVVVPDYMVTRKKQLLKPLGNALLLGTSYLSGERFNTPSPSQKILLSVRLRNSKRKWEALARKQELSSSRVRILYPLQMQPESNIDVFGRAWRDQVQLLRGLLANTPDDVDIWVKPNPKSKYEMNGELLKLVAENRRLIPLSHTSTMAEVLPKTDLVVTVTGTVAIECFFVNKPVVTMVRTLLNKYPGAIYVDDIGRLPAILDSISKRAFCHSTISDKVNYLNEVMSSSHMGLITDPYTSPSATSQQNLARIITAFRSHLTSLSVYAR